MQVIAVDIGGTCTDCVVISEEGDLTLSKCFSTPPNFWQGIEDVLRRAAESMGMSLESMLAATDLFLHSTSVAENALVDGTFARAGLITNAGFEGTLAAMRGAYGRWAGLGDDEKRNPLETRKPEPLVGHRLVAGVSERTDSRGNRLADLDEAEVRQVVGHLIEQGAESVAVCFLWSFLDPTAERKVREIALEVAPDLFVTLSSELSPVLGEYERTSTACLNAVLGPGMREYLARFSSDLRNLGYSGRILVMQSSGGLTTVDDASQRPVAMIESGPVAGLIGSQRLAQSMGSDNVIASDMGGTTFKVGVLRDGYMEYQRDATVVRYHYALPKLDITSLGVAGGSIVSVDPGSGLPRVGPMSAGASPGPACYGRGGELPTITDVDAVLGYMHPRFFLEGREPLDIGAAETALERHLATPLHMETAEVAANVYRMVNGILYDLLHKLTVQRGLDPRKFDLVSYGGTAGMHVASYAAALGVRRVIVPRSASVHSAYGLATADIVHEKQTTRPIRYPWSSDELASVFRDLTASVQASLEADGFGEQSHQYEYAVDMRYVRQVHVVTVPIGGSEDRQANFLAEIEALIDRFVDVYRERYGEGSGGTGAGVEIVSFRVRGSVPLHQPRPRSMPEGGTDASAAIIERRKAWIPDRGEYGDVDGYDFALLSRGNVVNGPAIVWSPITTIVLGEGDSASVDAQGNLLMQLGDR